MFGRFVAIAGIVLALAGPARAEWREDMGSFRIAVTAPQDARAAAGRIEPFRLALEQALGLPVEIVTMRNYRSVIDAVSRSRVEFAVLSASAYAAAYASCECVEPLVAATLSGGGQSFRQQLIVKNDGPQDLQALKGRKLAVVEAGPVGGSMLAMHELKEAGLDVETAAASVSSHADSKAAIAALSGGSVDALLGWSPDAGDQEQGVSRGTLSQIAELGEAAFEAKVIWQSSPIPYRIHAVRKNLAAEAKTILRSLLGTLYDTDPVAYDAIEPDYGGGFVAARQSQFAPLVKMFREAGLSAQSLAR